MATDLQVRTPTSVTDVQVCKLHKWFASFDTDDDGIIDVLDFTGMAQVYCEAYGIPPRSDSWRRMHESAHVVWRAIEQRTGTLNPAKLTLKEWVSWLGSNEYVDFVERAAIPFSLTAFSIADADGDSRCQVHEMMAAQHRSGMSGQEVHRSFDLLDADGDGYVTAFEFTEALREFYFSDDPDAPGNFMAGDLT
jgi:Ca2+-binding EF-hand superfamily protein